MIGENLGSFESLFHFGFWISIKRILLMIIPLKSNIKQALK